MLVWRRNSDGILECKTTTQHFQVVELLGGGCELMLCGDAQSEPKWRKLARVSSVENAQRMAANLARPPEE